MNMLSLSIRGAVAPLFVVFAAFPTRASEDLLGACRRGDITEARSALKDGANPNSVDEKGMPAIHLALNGRHFLIARLLLDAGADPAKRDMKGRDALKVMKDARRAPGAAVPKDVGSWVDMNVARDIVTLLHYADLAWRTSENEDAKARSGLMAVFGMASSRTPVPLDEMGLNVAPVPLEEMAKAQEIAGELLRKSRAPAFAKLARDSADRALLMAEIAYGPRDDRTLLTRHFAHIRTGRELEAPRPPAFHEGASEDCKKWMGLFRSQYTDAAFGDFTVFITLAVAGGKEKMGEDVLNEICRDYPVMALRAIQFRDPDGMTELHGTCSTGTAAVVRLLLVHGADPNAISCSTKLGATGSFSDRMVLGRPVGTTPLHVACVSGKVEVVEALLDFGAHPDIQLDDGRTALHLAASRGNTRIVTTLIQNGADISIKDRDGKTPHDHAATVALRRILERK